MESEPAGARGPLRRRIGVRALGIVPSALRHGWETCRAAGPGLKPEGRASAGGRVLSHLLATAQPVEGAALIRR
jgi:hypothetical protein